MRAVRSCVEADESDSIVSSRLNIVLYQGERAGFRFTGLPSRYHELSPPVVSNKLRK